MKIQYIASVFLDDEGAPSHHVRNTCVGFTQLGHTVTLLHPSPKCRWNSPTDIAEFRAIPYPRMRGGWRLFERLLASQLALSNRSAPFDVIYARLSTSSSVRRVLPGLQALKVLECNGAAAFENAGFAAFASAFDIVLVDSEAMRTLYCTEVENRPDKVMIQFNSATDTEVFRPMDKIPARTELGLPPDRVILFHVSGFQPHHDFDAIAGSVRAMISDGLPVLLLLVGDGLRRTEVTSAMADLVDSGHAVLTGAIPQSRLPVYVAASDVCLNVLTDHCLRQGNLRAQKLYDCAACSRPVVETVSSSDAVADWGREALWLIPPEDPCAIVEAVRCIVSKPELAAQRAEMARRYVVAERSWTAAARLTVSHLENALETKRAIRDSAVDAAPAC